MKPGCISNEERLTKLLNSYYINIVEKSVGTKPKTFSINFENTNIQSVRDIVNSYKSNESIKKIKQVVNGFDVSDNKRFSFKKVSEIEIKSFLRNLDIRKASDMDKILLKLVKLSHDIHPKRALHTKCQILDQ